MNRLLIRCQNQRLILKDERGTGFVMLVSLKDINKFYNGSQVLKNINLTIDENDRIGLIGANGCGKTTLLRIITGKEFPDRFTDADGIVSFSSRTSVGYLEQMGSFNKENTVWNEMKCVFAELDKTAARIREIEKAMSENENLHDSLADEYSGLMSFFEVNDGYNTDVKIKTILNGMGFSEKQFDRKISSFSGGEKTRLAIARLLLENPNLLILDEPTNHLDFKTVLWLEDYLKDYKGALLIVSHDRYFLDKTVSSICEIERGSLTRYKGNYTAYTRLKAESTARQKKEYELQQKEIAKMEDYIARNLVRASTAKSAQSRVKALAKMERVEKPVEYTKNAKISFTYAVKPPFDLLTVKNIDISVGYGEKHKVLAENVSFDVKCGEKVAVIGDNGIGKSTLLKIIQGMLPHKGIVRWAANVRISYFEQESSHLNPLNTVIEEIHSRYPIMNEVDIRNLLGQVRITGENVFKQISVISGGECAKLCFAIMMLEKGNVLILDEPTNHLDLASKEAIEEALEEFDGTVIFVSHDRYLINKIASKVIEITHDKVECFDGNFDNYLNITLKRRIQQQNIIEMQKQKAAAEKAEEKKVQAYRSKEQRSLEAQKRNRIKQLEAEMEEIQQSIDILSEEITREEIYTDFEVMSKKCSEIDRLKNLANEKFDEWAELSE